MPLVWLVARIRYANLRAIALWVFQSVKCLWESISRKHGRLCAGHDCNVYIFSLRGFSTLLLISAIVWKFRALFFNVMVFAYLMLGCLILIPAVPIVCFTTSAVKAVPLTVKMVFRTKACLVKFNLRPLMTDGAAGRLKGIANIYFDNTSPAVGMCKKLPTGGMVLLCWFLTAVVVESLLRRFSAAVVVTVFSVFLQFIQTWPFFINSWTFPS